MKSQRYYIKLFDQVLAAFDFVQDRRNPAYVCNLEIDESLRYLLPLNIAAEPTDDELSRFLSSRRIPKNRSYVQQVLEPYGISLEDTKGIIDITKGVSINDSYLVVAEDDPVAFSECNLYENDFNVALQVAAYSGVVSRNVLDAQGLPSELTVSGSFPKAWRIIEGKRVLFKAGEVRYPAMKCLMPYSEYLASQVARAMGVNAVSYGLERWRGRLCSTCEVFNTKHVSFVPLYAALPRRELARFGLDSALEFFYAIAPTESTAFVSMLVFDAVVANEDRHFGNYGVLRENDTGKLIGMAPLFDHNLSLFCDVLDSDMSLEQLIEAEKRYSSAFGSNLYKQLEDVMEPSQVGALERLSNFSFSLDDGYFAYADTHPDAPDAFSRQRLDALGSFVRFVANEALKRFRNR